MKNNKIHDKMKIVDGLIFWSDGNSEKLVRGNVSVANITVCGFQADFATACDDIAKWHAHLSRPDSTWHAIRTTADIDVAIEKKRVGMIMGLQNLKLIDDNIDRLSFFHALGVRVMQLTYNERNLVADGCLEQPEAGLSMFGRRVIAEMNRLRIAIDLSHVGERSCYDVIECSDAPVLFTHANAKAMLDVPRNKTDALLKAVAARGGTIGAVIHGFMLWDGNPANPPSLAQYVRHINYLRDLVGIEHVALGTDFPSLAKGNEVTNLMSVASRYPSTNGPFIKAFGNSLSSRYPADCNSPSELFRLTDALLAQGWSEDDLRAFYGGNLIRALGTIWGG
jgi:membrane dipeptidase